MAKFKNEILSGFSIIASAVENFQHFNDIFTVPEAIENLVFSADVLTSFLCSFDGHCLLRFLVKCLKYVAYTFEILIRFFCLLTKGATPNNSLWLKICVWGGNILNHLLRWTHRRLHASTRGVSRCIARNWGWLYASILGSIASDLMVAHVFMNFWQKR